MNITNENNTSNPENSVFSYSPSQWNQVTPQYMPWGHPPNCPPAPLVTFNAPQITQIQPHPQISQVQPHFQMPQIQPHPQVAQIPTSSFGFSQNIYPSTSCFGEKSILHCKRKADLDAPVPTKQLITEEKMAAHLERLHISTENHEPLSPPEDSITRQKRLYVCEEMKRLQTESILPSSILGRLERPCMAVMLWQPPAKIPELINMSQSTPSPMSSRGLLSRNMQEDENENNITIVDLNNMDMDSN